MKRSACCFLSVFFGLLSPTLMACDERKVGYWWYCEPPPQEKEVDEPPRPERPVLPAPPSPQDMMQMHPDDLAHLQEQYLKQAVWKMQPEQVLNYYKVLDVARRKSLAFTAVSNVVLLEHPELNARGQYQKTDLGRRAVTQQKNAQIASALSHYRDEFGLLVFTKKGCLFCQAQTAVLASFSERHGWPIKDIDIERDPLAAARFNIDYVPVTVLVQKNTDKWMPVAVGEEALTAIEASVYRVMRYLKGQTSPGQFLQFQSQDGTAVDPDYTVRSP